MVFLNCLILKLHYACMNHNDDVTVVGERLHKPRQLGFSSDESPLFFFRFNRVAVVERSYRPLTSREGKEQPMKRCKTFKGAACICCVFCRDGFLCETIRRFKYYEQLSGRRLEPTLESWIKAFWTCICRHVWNLLDTLGMVRLKHVVI